MAPGIKSGGRQAGTPNRVTSEARKAVNTLVNENIYRLSEWLNTVASGVKDESGRYVVSPNPSKAFQLLTTLMEYAIPKLGRMEVVGDEENPMAVSVNQNVFTELLQNLKKQRQLES